VTVFREHKHFETLYKNLIASFPGEIIPTIPVKSLFESDSIEAREAIDFFFQRICSNAKLCNSPLVRLFIQGSDRKFETFCAENIAEHKRRNSSAYRPSMRERLSFSVNNFLNGEEVRFSIPDIPCLFF
jgi:hypothetical protein